MIVRICQQVPRSCWLLDPWAVAGLTAGLLNVRCYARSGPDWLAERPSISWAIQVNGALRLCSHNI